MNMAWLLSIQRPGAMDDKTCLQLFAAAAVLPASWHDCVCVLRGRLRHSLPQPTCVLQPQV
jgi:hypothetical protein